MIKIQRISKDVYLDVATLLLGFKCVISLTFVLFLSYNKFYITVVEKKARVNHGISAKNVKVFSGKKN